MLRAFLKKNMKLPELFEEKMRRLLGEDFSEYEKHLDDPAYYGIRVNTLKISVEDFLKICPFHVTKVPWTDNGFYVDREEKPSKHPYYHAGLYYIQEPSAMTPASYLPVEPGDRVLDLCGAPGGKSTELGAKLMGEGLLVSNDVSISRTKALIRNIEMFGIRNDMILCTEAKYLVPSMTGFFNKILIDAPCSGEGMFRKGNNEIKNWQQKGSEPYAKLQREIVDDAIKLLAPGGMLLYSTCTFSPEENEQSVARFLSRHPEFSVEKPELAKYFSAGHPEWADGNEELKKTVRIWPHLADGEGHFLALLVKGESSGDTVTEADSQNAAKIVEKRKKGSRKDNRKDDGALSEAVSAFREFEKENLTDAEELEDRKKFLLFGENLYLVPEMMPDLKGLRVLRPGLHLGAAKKGRFEPSHALALFLKKEEVKQTVEIGFGTLALKYLRGETLREDDFENQGIPAKGWVLVTTGGMSLGFAKAAGGMLKNHYPKGLRIQGG